MTESAVHLHDEVIVDDELAADLARRGIKTFRPGDRLRLELVRDFQRTPEAEAAFAGQFDTGATNGSQGYREHLRATFAKRNDNS